MIDNNTGKTMGFYERGQAIFDRIPEMPEKKINKTKKINWFGLGIPERVAIVKQEYERIAAELYPDGVPMDAYKTDLMRHSTYQDYLHFADLLGKVLEKK